MRFKWSKKISVGDVTIDKQHKRLLDEILVLSLLLERGQSGNHIEETLGFLDRYISGHFTYEEGYMETHHYPLLDAHKEMHRQFAVEYEAMKREFAMGDTLAFQEKVNHFLGQWWVNHISHADQNYHEYIDAHPTSHPEGEPERYHDTIQKA